MESTEKKLVKVCKLNELPSGQSKAIKIENDEVGVFNINNKLYAISNICIHAGGALNEGSIDCESGSVCCPWHAWRFDLATGKCTSHARQDVFAKTFSVEVKDDEIFVSV